MTRSAVSRRNLLEAGACALAGAGGLAGGGKHARMDWAEHDKRGAHSKHDAGSRRLALSDGLNRSR
jgi:hypothetical protein